VNALNQYTRIGRDDSALTHTYDTDGNLIKVESSGSPTEYFYDSENRLVAVTNTLKNVAWSCEYDVFGNRVRITDNGVTTEKLYVQGAIASVAAEYINGSLVVRHILSGVVRIADEIEGVLHYYHTDGLSSIRLMTDDSGSIVSTASYKAFGDVRKASGLPISDGYIGALGVERDRTGLLYMRHRYYCALSGRFVQRDPLGLAGGDVNLYRYCLNNSVVRVDITGCSSLVCTAAAASGAATMTNPILAGGAAGGGALAGTGSAAAGAGAAGVAGSVAAGAAAFAGGFGIGVFLDGVQCGIRGVDSYYNNINGLSGISKTGQSLGNNIANVFSGGNDGKKPPPVSGIGFGGDDDNGACKALQNAYEQGLLTREQESMFKQLCPGYY